MPALQVYGRKWRIGSDDLVFPYIFSIMLRFCWFALIGVVLLNYDRSYFCHDEKLLKIYLFVLTSIHLLMVLVEMTIVVTSSMGTIANPEPRKNIHIPLYIQMVLFTFEFAWDIIGVIWAFDPTIDCHRSHSVLILSRCILIWNLFTSSTVGFYLIFRIGICQLPCCREPPRKMRYEQLPPTTTYGDARRLSSLSSGDMIHHKRQRRWQWRVQRLFCWMRLNKNQRTAFADVSSTLADAFTFFRGYVPSDILAGIALLAMEENKGENEDDEYDDNEARKVLDFHSGVVCKHYNRVVHYMKFALGAYGYPAYLYSTGIIRGLFKLSRDCKCKCKNMPQEVEEDVEIKGDSCGWNVKALTLTTGIENKDILYASFSSEVFCPGFYVAYDHKCQAVVVAVRGSLSLHDFITDLSAEPQMFSTCENGDIYGHRGMLIGAHAVQLQLENRGLIERAFKDYPNYRLILVGHSLGAAAASLLAIILKPKFPNLHCFAFSPPGCVINIDAVPYSRSFITSIVVGNDIVPRLRMESFEVFSERVLTCIQTASIPKYRIFLDSFFYLLGCCKNKKRLVSTTEMAINKNPDLITDFDANYHEDDIYDVVADAKLLKQTDKITGKQRITPRQKKTLFIPGRIIHITRLKPIKKCFGLYHLNRFQAQWTAHSEFSQLTLQENCVKHHTPDVVLKFLLRLQTQEHTLEYA